MANNRIRKQDAEKSIVFLTDIVKSYYLETEEEKKRKRNKGALKYLKDTMVGSVVLSPNPVKRMRKESFLNYFLRFVLPTDYDTLISYTDPEQNLKAFLDCLYFWENGGSVKDSFHDHGLELYDNAESVRSGGILMPFFLLQNLQCAVEQNLDTYLRQNVLSPYVDCERTAIDDNNDAAKEEKYIHLVYTLQYYEIFMEEFRKRIMGDAGQPQEEEIFRAMQEMNEEFTRCTEESDKVSIGKRLLDLTRECAAVLVRKHMGILYSVLYLYHFINLLAMLRILFIIEYVNINHGITASLSDKDKQRRRHNVELLVNEKLLGFDLFFFHYRENPNLARIFRELTLDAEERKIIPDLGNLEEINELRNNLETYIKQIRKKKAGEWDAEAEKALVKSRIVLAKPFMRRP